MPRLFIGLCELMIEEIKYHQLPTALKVATFEQKSELEEKLDQLLVIAARAP
jgi:hypothetical protein